MPAPDAPLRPPATSSWRAFRVWLVRASLLLVPTERHRVYGLTIVLGALCGLAAVSFHLAIHGVQHLLIDRALSASGAELALWGVLTPTLGGLITGWVLCHLAPAARGSGIPQVKYTYAVRGGRIRLRDATAKFCLAALQIGSGASLGREGPTVHICAGIASSFGRWFALSPQNQRQLVPVGAAAGIAAAFNAPIAAVTFVIEEILGDLDQTVLSGVVIAAAIAAVIERSVLGEHPVLAIPYGYGLTHASSLLVYVLLGVAAGLAAIAFYAGLLRLRAFVARHPGRWAWAWPAAGGAVTGAIAVALALGLHTRGATGDGYTTLSAALRGELPVILLLLLAAAKLVCTVASYSTGGCGGIFAPVLFIGGMLGGAFGHLDHSLFGHGSEDLGAFALVGMGAFFAAVIRAPITSVLIIFEMTGGYSLVLPLMLANAVAYALARRIQPVAIYEQLLHQDGLSLPDEQRVANVLSSLQVRDAMTTRLVSLPAELSVIAAQERVAELPFTMFPVVTASGALCGLVSQARLARRVAAGHAELTLSEVAEPRDYLQPQESLIKAVARMNQRGARQMLVVSSEEPPRPLGMLAMSDVMRAYASAGDSIQSRPPAPFASQS
ncbi:MAG TPA: chloride channel protein [Polyangiales bacterium]|nr:chloride channel protein [Polyangiales bacterium]